MRSGAEACAEEIAVRLSRTYDVTIVTAKMRRNAAQNNALLSNVKIIRVGLGCSIDKWLFPILAPIAVAKIKPDIVHAILETFAGAALIPCRILCPRSHRMLTLQTTNRQFLKKTIVRSAQTITAISSVLAEGVERWTKNDVRIIRNGIERGALMQATASIQKKMGRILFVGRLERMKGVDILLRAFASLHRNGNQQSPSLHIVGSGSLMNELVCSAKELGIADQTKFLGYLSGPELIREYAEAEIFCGLSRSEAMGNVFVEAQAAGCAVVASRAGGIPEVVLDEQTGILVPIDDAAAAASAIQMLLADDGLRHRIQEAGMRHAEAYDWDDIAAEYAQEYERIIAM
jgi:glycosyltransferase involved in cell wall biosynthesis